MRIIAVAVAAALGCLLLCEPVRRAVARFAGTRVVSVGSRELTIDRATGVARSATGATGDRE